MRKAYFPATRVSGDLDFSVVTAIDLKVFPREINAACTLADDLSGVTLELHKTSFKAARMIDFERQSFVSAHFHAR